MTRYDRRGRRLGAFELDQSQYSTIGELIRDLKPKPDRPACLWCGSRRSMCATRADGEALGCDLKPIESMER